MARLLLLVLLASCTSSSSPAPEVAGVSVARGYRVEVLAEGLRLPTALAIGPDERIYVAQLAGGENAAEGQILVLADGTAQPVLTGLFKPTGVAWREEALYIAAGPELLRSRREDDGRLSTPETLVSGLARNGRSAGQVTLLPDGAILFEESGAIPEHASGRLFMLPAGSETVQEIARGLKNSYAHTVGPDGTVYLSDVGEELVAGQPPPEEINVLIPHADYGWPRCYGARAAAAPYGGTATACNTTQEPLALLPPNSTPTGLAHFDGRLLVALWNGTPPAVLQITEDGAAEPFLSGLERPIALLLDTDGSLLVLDHAVGVLYRVTLA